MKESATGRLLLCRKRWQSQGADHAHGCCWESGHPDSLHHRCQCGAQLIVSYMHSPARRAPTAEPLMTTMAQLPRDYDSEDYPGRLSRGSDHRAGDDDGRSG